MIPERQVLDFLRDQITPVVEFTKLRFGRYRVTVSVDGAISSQRVVWGKSRAFDASARMLNKALGVTDG